MNVSSTKTQPNTDINEPKTSVTQSLPSPLKTIQNTALNDGTTNYWLTEGNVRRLEWTAGSTAAATGAIFTAIFGAPVIGSTAAVIAPMVLAGIALKWASNAYYTPDYDNTREVAGYREKAKYASLEETFNTHGNWVSDRKLLTQEQLVEKYLNKTKEIKTAPELLEYHKKIETFLNGSNFTLLSPQDYHKERLQKECSSLNLFQIIGRHSLDLIFSWELITPQSFKEKYLQSISSLKGIPSIVGFYEDIEKSRQKCEASNYKIPNPIELKEKFQKACESMSFKEIEDLHSLKYIFSWSLLTPRQFSQKYQQHAENLFAQKGITAVITAYKKTLNARNATYTEGSSFEIPHPKLLKNLWVAKNYSLQEILSQNIDELNEYGIISGTFRSFLQNFDIKSKNIDTKYKESKTTIEREYSNASFKASEQLDMVKKPTLIAKQALDEKKREQTRRIRDVSSELAIAKNKMDFTNINRLENDLSWLRSNRFFDDFFKTYPDWDALDRNLSKAEGAYHQTMEQIGKRREADLKTLNTKYSEEKLALEKEFQTMQSQ